MIILRTKLVPSGYKAMTIGPFILTRPGTKLWDTDINHEKIHWKQEIEMLIIFFYIWYCFEFLVRLIIEKEWKKAYRKISFEQEAYEYETNLAYPRFRPWYRWVKYLKK